MFNFNFWIYYYVVLLLLQITGENYLRCQWCLLILQASTSRKEYRSCGGVGGEGTYLTFLSFPLQVKVVKFADVRVQSKICASMGNWNLNIWNGIYIAFWRLKNTVTILLLLLGFFSCSSCILYSTPPSPPNPRKWTNKMKVFNNYVMSNVVNCTQSIFPDKKQ